MRLAQSLLDKVEFQRDNAALFIQKAPGVDPSGEGMSWFGYLAALERIKLEERRRSELYHPATYSELITDYEAPIEAPIHKSTTASTDFEAHLTYEEGASIEEVLQSILITFDKAKEQVFEDGMESDFSKELVSFIKNYSNIAVRMLTDLILNEEVNAEVASEALRWLGQIEDPKTYSHRLWLLEQSLYCSSARVRDGAALGLAFLDDPHAIPDLREAIQREPYPELREDLEQVLEQLENSHRCRSS
jgi:HEAT repeat protein